MPNETYVSSPTPGSTVGLTFNVSGMYRTESNPPLTKPVPKTVELQVGVVQGPNSDTPVPGGEWKSIPFEPNSEWTAWEPVAFTITSPYENAAVKAKFIGLMNSTPDTVEDVDITLGTGGTVERLPAADPEEEGDDKVAVSSKGEPVGRPPQEAVQAVVGVAATVGRSRSAQFRIFHGTFTGAGRRKATRAVVVIERRSTIPDPRKRPMVFSTVEAEYRKGLCAAIIPIPTAPPAQQKYYCYFLLLDKDDQWVAKFAETELPT